VLPLRSLVVEDEVATFGVASYVEILRDVHVCTDENEQKRAENLSSIFVSIFFLVETELGLTLIYLLIGISFQ
jgi:hypothetical protein